MMAQVMQIRLSQALDSSTVRPFLEKFISSRATLAVITAAMVLRIVKIQGDRKQPPRIRR